jgi:hypothetical protein
MVSDLGGSWPEQSRGLTGQMHITEEAVVLLCRTHSTCSASGLLPAGQEA